MTQAELAAAAGLHPTHISALERGLREPLLTTTGKLADALGVGLADLYGFLDAEGEDV